MLNLGLVTTLMCETVDRIGSDRFGHDTEVRYVSGNAIDDGLDVLCPAPGAVLLIIPNVLLAVFQIDKIEEVWIGIVGLLLLSYGAYYWTAVQAQFTRLYRMSIWVRWGIVVGLVALAFTVGPWQLVLFAAVDFAGGL